MRDLHFFFLSLCCCQWLQGLKGEREKMKREGRGNQTRSRFLELPSLFLEPTVAAPEVTDWSQFSAVSVYTFFYHHKKRHDHTHFPLPPFLYFLPHSFLSFPLWLMIVIQIHPGVSSSHLFLLLFFCFPSFSSFAVSSAKFTWTHPMVEWKERISTEWNHQMKKQHVRRRCVTIDWSFRSASRNDPHADVHGWRWSAGAWRHTTTVNNVMIIAWEDRSRKRGRFVTRMFFSLNFILAINTKQTDVHYYQTLTFSFSHLHFFTSSLLLNVQ